MFLYKVDQFKIDFIRNNYCFKTKLITNISQKLTNIYFSKGFFFAITIYSCDRSSLKQNHIYFPLQKHNTHRKIPYIANALRRHIWKVNVLMINFNYAHYLVLADFILANFSRRQFVILSDCLIDVKNVIICF